MTFEEDYNLLERYYREEDPIEKVILFSKIKKRGIDFFNFFTEECAFCGEIETLRNCQQIVLFEKNVTPKLQEYRNGTFAYRCKECIAKKKEMVDEIHELRKQQMRCRTVSGLVIDFPTFEILSDAIKGMKEKIRRMNTSTNGLVLSARENQSDFVTPMTPENIRKELVRSSIEMWLAEEKRKGFLKWAK